MSLGDWLESSSWGPGPRGGRFLQLRTEFAGNWPKDAPAERQQEIERLLKGTETDPPTWEDLLSAETQIAQFMSPAALRLKNGSLREEYAAIAGPSTSNTYLTRLADINNCTDDMLRIETIDLIGSVQKMRTLRQGFNLIRTTVTLIATLLAILFCVIIVSYFKIETTSKEPSGLFATTILVLSGMLGGCVSALSRLHSVVWSGDMAAGMESFSHLFWSLVLNFFNSIIIGGVFAVLLYLAFMGELVGGTIFPEFRPEPQPKNKEEITTFHGFFEAGLLTHGNYAKAVVWGFLAGFSERLVPDFLGNLGKQLKVKGS